MLTEDIFRLTHDIIKNTLFFLIKIQNVCKNKCAVCAMYSVHTAYIAHRAYILYMRVAQYAFLFMIYYANKVVIF